MPNFETILVLLLSITLVVTTIFIVIGKTIPNFTDLLECTTTVILYIIISLGAATIIVNVFGL